MNRKHKFLDFYVNSLDLGVSPEFARFSVFSMIFQISGFLGQFAKFVNFQLNLPTFSQRLKNDARKASWHRVGGGQDSSTNHG